MIVNFSYLSLEISLFFNNIFPLFFYNYRASQSFTLRPLSDICKPLTSLLVACVSCLSTRAKQNFLTYEIEFVLF